MKKSKVLSVLLVIVAFLFALRSEGFAQSGVFDRAGFVSAHGTYSSVPEETVDLFTGNLTLRYLDIFLPGPNGLNVEVWRVYNSKVLGDGSPGQGSVQVYPKSMLGAGWSMHMGILHQATSNTPVIEFPDGRRETAYYNNYSLGSNIYLTKDFLKLDKTAKKLYFQNGVVWTFSQQASMPLAGGGNETVYLVTEIRDPKDNAIQIEYDSSDSYRSIFHISDACGRQITFHKSYNGGNPAKLTTITLSNYTGTGDVTYSYTVGAFTNGFYRLDSFTPPCLAATTFEYNDGSSDHYELKKVTTSYGGVMEFTYANQNFYMGSTQINSRVVSQKKITFNAGEQAKVWNFSYPSYQGVTTGTTTVDGPEFDTSVTHNGYDSQNTWNIGLMTALSVSDGSWSEQNTWTSQQISTTNWMVMGINMGVAKGPLIASTTKSAVGDSTLRVDLTYGRTAVKKYGLPTRLAVTANGAPNPKSYKDLTYYFEAHSGYLSTKYIPAAVESETDSAFDGTILKKTLMTFFEVPGKWGATQQVKRLRTSPSTYYTWDYSYTQVDPSNITISGDPPGAETATGTQFLYGVPAAITAPYYTKTTRTISTHNSYVLTETNQHNGVTTYAYDDLGRVTTASLTSPFNAVSYSWQPGGTNQVVVTQGQSTITKFWDGMGRDLGYTENGDGTTLYYLRTLDAEGPCQGGKQGPYK